MGLRGSLGCAHPGSWSICKGMPRSVPGWPLPCQHSAPANGPPRGHLLPPQGVERVEVQSWERSALAKSRHTQRCHQQGLGEGTGIWCHEKGCGELKEKTLQRAHSPFYLIKQTQKKRASKGGHSLRQRTRDWGPSPNQAHVQRWA